jgi:hypothetical protein
LLRSQRLRRLPLASIAFAALAALVLFIILQTLGERGIRQDEAYTYFFVNASWHDFAATIHKLDIGIALYYLMLRWWSDFFGQTQFALRLFSVAFAMGSVVALYRLSCLLFSRNVGLISCSLLVLNCYWFQQGQTARAYSFATFVALVATIAYVNFLRSSSPMRWSLAYILAMLALTGAQYALAVTIFVGHFLSMPFIEGRKRSLRSTLPVEVAILVILAGAAYIISSVGNTLIGPTEHVNLANIARQVSALLGRKYAVLVLGFFALLGLAGMPRSTQRNRYAVAIWAITPIVVITAISFRDSEALGARNMMAALCPFVLAAAYGISQISRGPYFALAFGTALIAECIGLSGYLGGASQDFENKVHQLANEVRPGDTVVFSPPYLAVRANVALQYAKLSLPRGVRTAPSSLRDAWQTVDQRIREPDWASIETTSSGTVWLFTAIDEDSDATRCETQSDAMKSSTKARVTTICALLTAQSGAAGPLEQILQVFPQLRKTFASLVPKQ